jgi:hypothetical protein
MDNPVDGTDGKLGRGFMSADKLEEVDIGSGDKPRPTFISANLQSDFRGGNEKLWMSVRVDLQGISTDYFIDRRGALGVMTGQRTLLEYQAAGFSSRTRRVFV